MKRALSLCALCLSLSAVVGVSQERPVKDDVEAQRLLRDLSAAVKAKPSVTAEFDISVVSPTSGKKAAQHGSLKLQGDKYVLELGSIVTYSDGHTVWVHQREAKEVDISVSDDDPDEMTPARLFQSFGEGYRQHLVGRRQVGAAQVADVDLYPTQKSDLVRLRLTIDVATWQLREAMQQMRNGDKVTIAVTAYRTDKSYPDATFRFDTAAHPDVEVVDLR